MNIELSKSTKLSQSHTKNLKKDSTNVTLAAAFSSSKKNPHILISSLNKVFESALKDKSVTGKFQECVLFRQHEYEGHKNLALIGLGEKWEAECLRQIGSTILSAAKSTNATTVSIYADSLFSGKGQAAHFVQALAEGILLSEYTFNELKSKKENSESTQINFQIVTKFAADSTVKKALQSAETLIDCVNFSRRLGDMPGNLMTPTILAENVLQKIKGTGIKAEIWDRARIKKEKMGGLLGVAQGSRQEPRFIILKYNGSNKSKKPIVFVGKGLTFDSGGISLKPGANMEEMKYDMCGGANVLGGLIAIAKLKLKVNAVALVPATENMPGGAATKPGDIHTARNGKTFEVNNTDAEGRLILSDALCYGSELKPQMMVDAATLTGAMVIALGNIHTGFFTKNDPLAKKIEKAGHATDEQLWRMPLCEHHTKDMKGTFADLSNISSGKGAGSATAAAFLEQFVEEGIPWAHFDIAGTGWAVGNRLPYCSKKGASGVLVRTFVELAKQFE